MEETMSAANRSLHFRRLKEEFVTDLGGTTLLENVMVLSLLPLLVLNRGVFNLLWPQVHPSWFQFFCDLMFLVLPIQLSLTLFSGYLSAFLATVLLSTLPSLLCLLWPHVSSYDSSLKNQLSSAFSATLSSNLSSQRLPCVTAFRSCTLLLTAICILAVDFRMFPRRFAKTEVHGTGLMDLGTGCFVLANALTAPEAREMRTSMAAHWFLKKQVVSTSVLVGLGMGRLVATEITGYHGHVTEYGIHWNFFFTLAVIRIFAALLRLTGVRRCWCLALIVATAYELALLCFGLKSFILHGRAATGDRTDFISANREGLASTWGYMALYLGGVELGRWLRCAHRGSLTLTDWLWRLLGLLFANAVFWSLLSICQVLVDPVSRRLANLGFQLWTLAQGSLLLSLFLLVDVTLAGLRTLLRHFHVSSGRHRKPVNTDQGVCGAGEPTANRSEHFGICLLDAINRNALLFFLLANLGTGLTNLVLDTLSTSSGHASIVLSVYILGLCLSMHLLQSCLVKSVEPGSSHQ
uniref:phosphatidylinositol-glycan biosynthesis class W protein n=1 Tax=Myxine glutinosa TaxID=7769 RepID=UPI00358DF950